MNTLILSLKSLSCNISCNGVYLRTTVLCIGDLHIKNSNLFEIEELLQQIQNIIVNYKPDITVFLGDILDTHDIIHLQPFLTITRFLDKIQQYCKIYILIGNHDRPNNKIFLTDEHCFNPFKKWENIVIVDTTFQDVINKHIITFVPYVPVGRFIEALEQVDWKKSIIIFAHQELYGCKLNSINSTKGDRWDIINPLVVSGHIHDYHELQDNIIYIGTPIQHNFGEEDNKGIYIFKFEDSNKKMEKIPIDVIHKKTLKLNVEEFKQYNHITKDKHLLKIIIEDYRFNLDSIKNTIQYLRLKNEGVIIVCKELVESSSLVPFDTAKKYTELLKDELKKIDTSLINVFEDVLKF
jgi:DNA repair exonuclease SbcCD nuclease subunit